MLVRVVAPHFVAGIVIEKGICVAAAPILRRCQGASVHWCYGHFIYQGWTATQIPDRPAAAQAPAQASLDLV
jgi:hypothetical protein